MAIVIAPGDASYDESRKVYNGMIDRRPALIALCANTPSNTCVNFARDHGVPLAIRGGGHNAGGLGVCDDGMVIDMSVMKGVHVDTKRGTVRVEGAHLGRC